MAIFPIGVFHSTHNHSDPEKAEEEDTISESEALHDLEDHIDVEELEEELVESSHLQDANPELHHGDENPQLKSRKRWRRISLSTFPTLSSFTSTSNSSHTLPKWYLALKKFLFPPNSSGDLDSFLPYYRYTPITSGLMIPFSILLEIPGLTDHWYIRTVENQVVETQPNTPLLSVGLGISMSCAVIANIALIMRFLEKNIKFMTVVCVVSLTIHDVINITAVTTFGVEHRFDDGFTYGTAFWMTLCSTIASTFTNLTLIGDLIQTPDFASSGSGLTKKQRSLIIIVILLLCYIAFGALINSVLLEIRFVDALYFTICTIETIGFGDIPPISTGARVFTCLYATIGVVNLALAVAMARETVIEAMEVSYRRHMQDVRRRRKNARWKRRVKRRWKEAVEWRLKEAGKMIWVTDDEDEIGTSRLGRRLIKLADKLFPWPGGRTTDLGDIPHPHGLHLNLEALTNAQLEGAAMEAGVPLCDLIPEEFWTKRDKAKREGSEEGERSPRLSPWMRSAQVVDLDEVPLTHARLGRMSALLGGFALAVGRSGVFQAEGKRPSNIIVNARNNNNTTSPSSNRAITKNDLAESKPEALQKSRPKSVQRNQSRMRIKNIMVQELDMFRASMENEERRAWWGRFIVAWVLFVVFWMIGSGVFSVTEGWSFGVAMYFCFISFTTIGFGDFSPKTPAGRSVFVVWALFGVATMTILISVVAEAYQSSYKQVFRRDAFAKAVEIFKGKERMDASKPKPKSTSTFTSAVDPDPSNPSHHASQAAHSKENDHEVIHQKTKEQLEKLPRDIIRQCRSFYDHLKFFATGHQMQNTAGGEALRVPESVKKLLEDIAGAENLGSRVQSEILKDPDARHTLFTLGIERELKKMIESAEEAIAALEERDRLLAIREGNISSSAE